MPVLASLHLLTVAVMIDFIDLMFLLVYKALSCLNPAYFREPFTPVRDLRSSNAEVISQHHT